MMYLCGCTESQLCPTHCFPLEHAPLRSLLEVEAERDGIEERVYKCSADCGAELTIEFPEECNWDEFQDTKLNEAGWIMRGQNYLCGICKWNEEML